MQPRTLYTLLLMLVIIGSALGSYPRELEATPIELRQWIVNSLRHFERGQFYGRDLGLAKDLLMRFSPDPYSFHELYNLPLDELCRIVSAYYKLAPLRSLNDDLKEKYFDLRNELWHHLHFEI
uniref:DUF4296 domain-containing protein n=1 Tax=Panagrellus redivivus TaxID=6233 RepID=A0A7E4V0H9_PANRE